MKKQTQEQGPPAGRVVRKVSLNVRVNKIQRNDKKIKELLKEHICKRPHSPGNPAGLYSGRATPSRVCRTRQDLFLVPACLTSGSSPGYQCTHPETATHIQ